MKISIVIPTLNEELYIGGILKDLSDQSKPPHEIIVVDGDSKDRTTHIAMGFSNVRVIKSKPNVARQRELGCHRANGELIILFDADVRVPLDFLEKVEQMHLSCGFELACPRYIPADGSILIRFFGILINFVFVVAQYRLPSGAGPCIITTKERWKCSGGFKSVFKFDDIEFIRRAGRLGNFKILPLNVYISTRRFKKYGTVKTIFQYLKLSILFTFNAFGKSNQVDYKFGEFSGCDECKRIAD